jgi:hypothetical protein
MPAKAAPKFKTAEEREQESYEASHTPIQRQLTSAEVAEANSGGAPVLTPEPRPAALDPNLDPNVKRGTAHSTAAPARTEMTRQQFYDAGVVEPPKAGQTSTMTTLAAAQADADADKNLREENAKRASAPFTTSNPAEVDEKGKTKPEVVKAMKEQAKAAEEAEADTEDEAEDEAEEDEEEAEVEPETEDK